MVDTIVYDLEISKTIIEAGGWDNHNSMGLGSAVAYSFNQDRYFFYLHDSDKPKIINLLNGNRVITYNGIRFDSKVLLGEDREIEKAESGVGILVYNKSRTVKWLEFDIYLQILKSQYNLNNDFDAIGKFPKGGKGGLKLGGVTQATLGVEQCKTSSGAEAPKMYKAGAYSTLLEYNLQDTILTTKLYKFIRDNNFIKDAFGKQIDLNVKLRKTL